MDPELDEKKIQEIRRLIPQLVQEGLINRKEENKHLVEFYLALSEEALKSSRVVYKVSTNEEIAKIVCVSDKTSSLTKSMTVTTPKIYGKQKEMTIDASYPRIINVYNANGVFEKTLCKRVTD